MSPVWLQTLPMASSWSSSWGCLGCSLWDRAGLALWGTQSGTEDALALVRSRISICCFQLCPAGLGTRGPGQGGGGHLARRQQRQLQRAKRCASGGGGSHLPPPAGSSSLPGCPCTAAPKPDLIRGSRSSTSPGHCAPQPGSSPPALSKAPASGPAPALGQPQVPPPPRACSLPGLPTCGHSALTGSAVRVSWRRAACGAAPPAWGGPAHSAHHPPPTCLAPGRPRKPRESPGRSSWQPPPAFRSSSAPAGAD